MTRLPTTHRQQGFTIIELMIATVVFSLVLLVIAAGVIRFSDQYIKSITSSKTQAVARSIMSDVAQNIQFSPGQVVDNDFGGYRQLCAGSMGYSYVIGQQVLGSTHGLIKDSSGCGSPGMAVATSSQSEMLGQRMRLAQLDVSPAAAGAFQVTLVVVSGSDDMLTDSGGRSVTDGNFQWPDVRCKPQSGSQFCAVSKLTTVVLPRISS